MYKEQAQTSARPHGEGVRWTSAVIDEDFAKKHGIDLNTNDKFRVAAVSYDENNRVVQVIPMVLSEADLTIFRSEGGTRKILDISTELAQSDKIHS